MQDTEVEIVEAEEVTEVTEVAASEVVEVSVVETAEAMEAVAAAVDLEEATKWEEEVTAETTDESDHTKRQDRTPFQPLSLPAREGLRRGRGL